jgi:tetratricopeptide (TPR) repeat protein
MKQKGARVGILVHDGLVAKRSQQVRQHINRDFLTGLFVRGQASGLVERSETDFETAKSMDLLVAALVLRGDLERALAIAATREARDHTGMISFYLCLGLTRAGRYEEAQSKIYRLGSLRRVGLVEFYLQQAQGFVSFICGKPDHAVSFSRKALIAAEASAVEAVHPQRLLARVLSLDLLGHSLVQTGQLRSGIKTLKLAKEAANRAEHENFTHAISISLLKYEAAFGIEPTRIVSRLYRALIELKPNDSYSRSELRLELSRQLILRGQLRQARSHLEEAAADILGSRNHQQTASLHMKQAWLARLEGRFADTLLGLQATESVLLDQSDSDLRSKTRFFRLETLQEMGEVDLTARDRALKLAKSLRESQDFHKLHGIERRMVQRKFGDFESDSVGSFQISKGEDPFGDLMDRLQQKVPGVEGELLQKGYFGLLVPLLGINFGHKAIILGVPKGAVIIVDGGETRVSESGLGGLLGRLILRLADGACTRKEAIEQIWGYRYEAERHDRLLAVAVSRIRKVFGGNLKWVEMEGDRIVLQDQVLIRYWSGGKDAEGTRLLKNVVALGAPSQDSLVISSQAAGNAPRLRIRQLQVLRDLVTRGDVGVPDLVERFGISRSSALRDLNELVELGLLTRMGDTRATRYMRT